MGEVKMHQHTQRDLDRAFGKIRNCKHDDIEYTHSDQPYEGIDDDCRRWRARCKGCGLVTFVRESRELATEANA